MCGGGGGSFHKGLMVSSFLNLQLLQKVDGNKKSIQCIDKLIPNLDPKGVTAKTIIKSIWGNKYI